MSKKTTTLQPTAEELLFVQPFIDIQNRLLEKVPALLYVDEDWGQLDYYGDQPPVQWPCALIDCSGINVTQMGNRTMIDEIDIIIRVADMRLSNSSGQASDFQKNAHYQLFAIMADVIKQLHGWTGSPNVYGRLQRVSQLRRQKNNSIRLYEIGFTCALTNRVAETPRTFIPATPVITRG